MKEKSSIEKVIELVLSSERKMPAHFNSDGERLQTFFVDFKDLSPEDEYDMASNAWYEQPAILSDRERIGCLKIGEDIMIGSYILTKLGHAQDSRAFKEKIITIEIQLYPEMMRDALNAAVSTDGARDYFNFCERYGVLKAEGSDTASAFTYILSREKKKTTTR